VALFFINGLTHVSLAEQARFAYFFDASGAFWKVEAYSNQVIAHGKLQELDELKKLMPPEVRDGVLVNGLQYDPNLHRVYLVIQKKIWWVTQQETELFQIFVLELPTFRLVTTFPQKPLDFVPRFLITPDGEKLLMSRGSVKGEASKTHIFTLETYDARSFKLLSKKSREVPEEELGNKTVGDYIKAAQGAYFSENARFGPDGETIYDEGYQIVGDRVVNQVQRPLPAEVERFNTAHPCVSGSCFLLQRVDEEGGRMLFWERAYQERVRPIYDGSTGKSWEEQYRVLYATGRFALYDALASPKLREFKFKELEGDDPKVIGFTPDGQVMYWAKGTKELYAVNLTGDPKPVRIEVFGLYAQSAWCVFADR
jgi:hypothetical protein